MVIIPQGKPTSGHFVVAFPPNKAKPVNETVVCKHPTTGKETTGKCVAVFHEQWEHVPDSFSLLTYGVTASKLREGLEKSFPDFRDQQEVIFLLIKEQ